MARKPQANPGKRNGRTEKQAAIIQYLLYAQPAKLEVIAADLDLPVESVRRTLAHYRNRSTFIESTRGWRLHSDLFPKWGATETERAISVGAVTPDQIESGTIEVKEGWDERKFRQAAGEPVRPDSVDYSQSLRVILAGEGRSRGRTA